MLASACLKGRGAAENDEGCERRQVPRQDLGRAPQHYGLHTPRLCADSLEH
jgi:hypothetical protein